MADWENPSNKNAKTLRIGIIPRVVCGASRVRTGDPLLAFSENPWESKIMHESAKG